MKHRINVGLLIQKYNKGASQTDLAEEFGVSRWTVNNRLKRAGVEIRSSGNQRAVYMSNPITNEFSFVELVDGLVLGDGSIDGKGFLRLQQRSECVEWIEQTKGYLRLIGSDSKIIPLPPRIREIDGRRVRDGGGNLVYTPSYQEIWEQRRRWYPDGVKRLPEDVVLTPFSMSQWFNGDGTGHAEGMLTFCTHHYEEHEVDRLTLLMNEVFGFRPNKVKSSREGQFTIQLGRKDEAVAFKEMVWKYVPECFKYKFRYVRPTIRQGQFTDQQVKDIKMMLDFGETKAELARMYEVGESCIFAIATGKSYKYVGDWRD
jgi:biotin operon repressor